MTSRWTIILSCRRLKRIITAVCLYKAFVQGCRYGLGQFRFWSDVSSIVEALDVLAPIKLAIEANRHWSVSTQENKHRIGPDRNESFNPFTRLNL